MYPEGTSWLPTQFSCICSDHFLPEDYTNRTVTNERILKITAVPTQRSLKTTAVPLIHNELTSKSTAVLSRPCKKSEYRTGRKPLKQRFLSDEVSREEISCLVCHIPFWSTKSRLIPNLPFCKVCKKIYFTHLSQFSKSGGAARKTRLCCPYKGRCVIDYRYVSSKDWCAACHYKKLRAILRRFDALQLNPCNKQALLKNPELNPVVLVEKLTERDLALYGIEICSAKDETFTEDHPIDWSSPELAHLSSQTGSHQLTSNPAASVPESLQLSKRRAAKSTSSLQFKTSKKSEGRGKPGKKSQLANSPLTSMKIYVFSCGHACDVCNSSKAKEFLKISGYHTAQPDLEDAIYFTHANNPSTSTKASSLADGSSFSVSDGNGFLSPGLASQPLDTVIEESPHSCPHLPSSLHDRTLITGLVENGMLFTSPDEQGHVISVQRYQYQPGDEVAMDDCPQLVKSMPLSPPLRHDGTMTGINENGYL